jgi:hypothetical protein
VVSLISMLGYGIYLTAGVLYFTRVLHLPPVEAGAGLSIAAGISLLAGIPVGHLADRHGTRGVYAVTLIIGAVAMGGLCLAHGFWTFLPFACLGSIAQSTGPAARGPLVQQFGGDRPAEFRSTLRAVSNVGMAAGALVAAWAIEANTRDAYVLLIAGSAVSYAASTAVVMFLPSVPSRPSSSGPRWVALRDRPYLLVTVLDGVMAIQYRVLTAAVPLWLVSRTSAPRWSISGVMVLNTAIVVFFQVRASRSIDTPQAGGAAFRRAGFAFLISCVTISLLGGLSPWVVLALLVVVVIVHTVGEIWHAAGGFELSFSLAPENEVGQYQGLFGMGLGLGVTAGPALLIALCIGWGVVGWWIAGVMFALTGLAVPAAARWAEHARPPHASSLGLAEVAP